MSEKIDDKLAEIRAAIELYHCQVGRVASAWNDLQMALGWIFERTVQSSGKNILGAIWHSQQSDRNQRRMLRAAVEAGAFSEWPIQLPKKAESDILWLIKEADSLSGRRDEALHSPVAFANTQKSDSETVKPTSLWAVGSPLAIRLRGKELMDELSLSEWRARRLAEYARAMWSSIHVPSSSWPSKRPELNRELHRQLLESDRLYDIE
jgi:hypothetical protein